MTRGSPAVIGFDANMSHGFKSSLMFCSLFFVLTGSSKVHSHGTFQNENENSFFGIQHENSWRGKAILNF